MVCCTLTSQKALNKEVVILTHKTNTIKMIIYVDVCIFNCTGNIQDISLVKKSREKIQRLKCNV